MSNLKLAKSLKLACQSSSKSSGTSSSGIEAQNYLHENIRKSQKTQSTLNQTLVLKNLHQSSINTIAISPCNTFLLEGTLDGTIFIYNIPKNKLEEAIECSSGNLNSISFSNDGQLILCIHQSFAEIWNFHQRTLKFRMKTSLEIHTPALFTTDGKFIIIPDKKWLVFSRISDKTEEFCLNGHKMTITSIACSADGKHLISGAVDGCMIVWNLNLRRKELKMHEYKKKISFVAISNNSKYVACIFTSILKVWNLEKRCQVFTAKHFYLLQSVLFAPDDKTLAACSGDNTISVCNVEGKKVERFYIWNSSICSICFSSDQKKIFGGDLYGNIVIWNTFIKPKQISIHRNLGNEEDSTRQILISINSKIAVLSNKYEGCTIFDIRKGRIFYENKIEAVFYSIISNDGSFLLQVKTKKITILDLKTTITIFEVPYRHIFKFYQFPASKDLSLVVTTNKNNSLGVWNTINKFKIFDVHKEYFEYSTAKFSNDCKFIAFGSTEGNISIWSIEDMAEIYTLTGHLSCIKAIFFTDDEKLISVSFHEYIRVWNMKKQALKFQLNISPLTYQYIYCFGYYLILISSIDGFLFWNLKENFAEFKFDYKFSYNFVNFSNNGKHLCFLYEYHSDIWKLKDFLEINTIDQYKSFFPLKFSYNKKFAVSGHEKMIKVWNVDDKKEILRFKAHKYWIRAVSISFDNKFIVSGGDDGSVKIWDLNGFEVKRFDGHLSWVLSVAISRDGKFVISASNDRVLILWEVEKNDILKSFRGFGKMIHSISFSFQGRYIAVDLNEGVVHVLKV